MASPKISIISEQFNFQNSSRINDWGKKQQLRIEILCLNQIAYSNFVPWVLIFAICRWMEYKNYSLAIPYNLFGVLELHVKCYHRNMNSCKTTAIATILLFSITIRNPCNLQTFSAYSILTLLFFINKSIYTSEEMW